MAQGHLKLSDIQYLALEGGGGKGFAYLGALQLLESNKALTGLDDDINVLSRIKGVAGSSAGAITALMIALGMSSQDILNEIRSPSGLKSFDDFFDHACPRLIPLPGGRYLPRKDGVLEKAMIALMEAQKPPDFIFSKFFQLLAGKANLVSNYLSGALASNGPGFMGLFLVNYLAAATTNLEKEYKKLPVVVKLILDEFEYYDTYAQRDMGFFCGYKARRYFDGLIMIRCAKAFGGNPGDYANLTFEDFHKMTLRRVISEPGVSPIRFIDLLVCGSNLSTGVTELFSHQHTPKFPIADAVRISMSIPIAFKPYVIGEQQKGGPPCGTYIDGGYWNNLPFREVDPKGTTDKTLGIRLEIEPPKMICTFLDLQVAMTLNGLYGGGESQVIADFAKNIILLDTDRLSLFDFNPPSDVQELINHRSRRTVCKYFGWPVDPADRNDKDEAQSAARREKTACGKCEGFYQGAWSR